MTNKYWTVSQGEQVNQSISPVLKQSATILLIRENINTVWLLQVQLWHIIHQVIIPQVAKS